MSASHEQTRRRWSAAIGATSTAVAIGFSVGAALGSAAIAAPLLVIAVLAPLAWSLLPSPAAQRIARAPRAVLAVVPRAVPMPLSRGERLGSIDDVGDISPPAWLAYVETAPITRVAIEVS